MPILDVFNTSAYNVISLTAAINKVPYMPTRLGRLGLFRVQSITTATAVVEEREGKLALIQTAVRGNRSASQTQRRDPRHARSFLVPHCPQSDALLADSLQGVRAFGQENATEVFATIMNDKLTQLRQNHEATFEWHRVGALKGLILDADGTTIYDLFSEFGISQDVVNFDFTDNGTYDDANPVQDMKLKALEVVRLMQSNLGGTPLTGVHALCGDQFFDRLISHPTVRRAWERQQDSATGPGSMGQFLRAQQSGYDSVRETGFEFGGITWENYRGSIGTQQFFADDECQFFPVGTPDVFTAIQAPADYVETVNTPGKPVYAKQERIPFDKGVDIESQSNVLFMCNRPSVLIAGQDVTPTTTAA